MRLLASSMSMVLLLWVYGACTDRGLTDGGAPHDGGGDSSPGSSDLAGADLSSTIDFSGIDLAGVDLAPEPCMQTPADTCGGGTMCSCCPASGISNQQNCLCSTTCSSDGDCHDVSRPHCEKAPNSTVGFCAPQGFFCCWLCQ
jgi:hypothetical protein